MSGFTGVRLTWLGDLEITQGDSEGLTIDAEDNILPLITSEVVDGTLVVGLAEKADENAVIPTQPVRYGLQVRQLDLVDLSGAGRITRATRLRPCAARVSALGRWMPSCTASAS